MLVRQTDTGWQIIYHRAHAVLAAQIALAWKDTGRVARLAETITAIAQHDDLEREYQGDHLSAAGAPLDFTLGEKQLANLDPWRGLLDDALLRGRWVALLTAMHIQFLNAPQRHASKKLAAFLDELTAQQAEWCNALGISQKRAEQAYALMQLADRTSLILCGNELPSRERWLEIGLGPDGERYDIQQRADGTVNVAPWPFYEDRFTVTVDAVLLHQAQFKSNTAFVAALRTAPVHALQWEFAQHGGATAGTDPGPAAGAE